MALLILLLCLAVYRATRLIVADDLTLPFRLWVFDRFGDDGKMAYLVECPWCMSVYVGGIAVGGLVVCSGSPWHLTRGVVWPLAVWPATSAFTGVVSELLGVWSRTDDLLEQETK